jgi:anti-sigma B factor antagonist
MIDERSTRAKFDAWEGSQAVPPLAAMVTHHDDRAIVHVSGDLDLASAPAFQRQVLALLSSPIAAVTLDLDRLTFLDSSGLRAFVAIAESADEHNIKLTIANVPEQAHRVLELTGLTDALGIDVSNV